MADPGHRKGRPKPVINPLAKFGVSVRRQGAEHGTLGTNFDFKRRDVEDFYRNDPHTVNTRCMGCGVNFLLGAKSGKLPAKPQVVECKECKHLTEDAKERLRKAQQEEAERYRREQEETSARIALEMRKGYYNMFKPKGLDPLENIYSSDEESEQDEGELMEELSHRPAPKQLESLYFKPFDNKDTFIETLTTYQQTRNKLEELAIEAKHQRQLINERLAREAAKAARAQYNEQLVSLSLRKLLLNNVQRCFYSWRQHVDVLLLCKRLIRRSLQQELSSRWDRWLLYLDICNEEKLKLTVILQCLWRRYIARRELESLREIQRACIRIQCQVRARTARAVLAEKRREHDRHQQILTNFFKHVHFKSQAMVFFAWAGYTRTMRNVSHRYAAACLELKTTMFKNWKSAISIIKRLREKRAVATLQRAGRKFVKQIQARRDVLHFESARTIQSMCRCVIARERMRIAIRQNQGIKRKIIKYRHGLFREMIDAWKLYTFRSQGLERLRSNRIHRELSKYFGAWHNRRKATILVQKVYRGYRARIYCEEIKAAALKAMLQQQEAIKSQEQLMKMLFAEEWQSPLLASLRREFRLLKEKPADGSDQMMLRLDSEEPQPFSRTRDGEFLNFTLTALIKNEILRVQRDEEARKENAKSENDVWLKLLRSYAGRYQKPNLSKKPQMNRNAGKTFNIKLDNRKEVTDTIRSWKEMFELKYVTLETLISWSTEGLLLKKGARAEEKLLVWEVLKEIFDDTILTMIAYTTLEKIERNHTRL